LTSISFLEENFERLNFQKNLSVKGLLQEFPRLDIDGVMPYCCFILRSIIVHRSRGDNMAISVMVADDESIIRMDIVEELSEAGFDVIAEAADGYDAIECCRKMHPDVALIDINMPVIDGMNVARTILSEKLVRAVVMITAYNNENYMEEAGSIGVGGYIVKPIKENSVIPAIRIALAQSRHLQRANESATREKQKTDEWRVIDRAKGILAQQLHCTEMEALRRMQQDCMKKGCRLADYAKMILDANTGDDVLQKAKTVLMKKNNLSENAAYHRIRNRSQRESISLAEAARRELQENE